MIYISTPYSHSELSVIETRMRHVNAYALQLLKLGKVAVSPVIVGHEHIKTGEITSSHSFWLPYSEQMLRKCDEVHVLCLAGWDTSTGVAFEVKLAEDLNILVRYIQP